jgi:hypothetical protein
MVLFSPLEPGQAFQPKPIRALSSQNLEDPIAMSFYKLHIHQVRNLISQKFRIQFKITAERIFLPVRLDDSTSIFKDS